MTAHTFGPRKAVGWNYGIQGVALSGAVICKLFSIYLMKYTVHSTGLRGSCLGHKFIRGTKTRINGNMVLINSCFHMQNNCCDNYLQFAQALSEMFFRPCHRQKTFKEYQF
jgi:hypothetical protein